MHVVGSGRGPPGLFSDGEERGSAWTLSEVDWTEHARQPVERHSLAVDRHVLDASHVGRRDRERPLRRHFCGGVGHCGELVKTYKPTVDNCK